MALKVDYVVKETGTNLLRNISLTLASIVTVAVSLILVGSALMIRAAVDNATSQWEGGIEFIVFMQPDATEDQLASVETALTENPQVTNVKFVNKEETLEEFQDLFKGTPQLVENVSADILPPSYRVVPETKAADAIQALGEQFETRPGVRDVVFAFETIRRIQQISTLIGNVIIVAALLLLAAATLLILNTIRMAMFARRREIEVMKLVGASNWFVRVPFMLEGVTAGLIGSAFAVGAVNVLDRLFDNLSTNQNFLLLSGFTVDSGETFWISMIVVATGVLIGAAGSGFAVSRYLDV